MAETRLAFAAVIGGGCVGLATAHALAHHDPGRIVLIEREAMHGAGSTGLGAGGVRAQFSTDINIRLSIESMRIFADFERETGEPLRFDPIGYLFLAATDDAWRDLCDNNVRQRALGVPAELLDPAAVAERLAFLDASRLRGAAWCPVDGVTDPHALVQGYAASARRRGEEMAMSTMVRALRHERDRGAWIVETDRGEVVATGFSGHGFMHAPAIGRHLAHLIAHGRSMLDLTPLSPMRFTSSEIMAESRYV